MKVSPTVTDYFRPVCVYYATGDLYHPCDITVLSLSLDQEQSI